MRQVDAWRPSRRDILKLGMAAGVAGLTGLAGCGAVPAKPDQSAPQLRGGVYSHGATGGGLKDTLEPYFPVTNPDIARCMQLYEPLLRWNANYEIEPSVAESATPNGDNTQWTIKLRDGVEFHHGKSLTAEDVMFSLKKVTDPEKPGSGGTELSKILELQNSKIVDPKTILLQLNQPYAVLDQLLAEYTVGILPTDFDVSTPVGTGPFKYNRFVPGQLSQFDRFDNYWDGPPFVDQLIIYDFADDAAKVNALLAGQVQSIDNLPNYLAGTIEQQGASPLVSESGAWVPFTMRVDVAPFSDVRVRQALRLIVDRKQMIDNALSGFGRLGNDLYAPFDVAYADDLPQREQDIDKAKALLKSAGREGLQVQLFTGDDIGSVAPATASLFVQQAKKAGVDVKVIKKNPFYGDDYLKYPFGQDFWNTRLYLPQAAVGVLKGGTYNETHWDKAPEYAKYAQLDASAAAEVDETKRNTTLQDAQKIEYDSGGYIIWGFRTHVDAVSQNVQGLKPSKFQPLGNYDFKTVSISS